MTAPIAAASPDRSRRAGRPARISRDMIAEAADELGLENLTLRAVADHLGVSIAALYHHVASKEDLLRIGAEVAAGKLPRPRFEGQHWSAWLLEWGLYNRDEFVDDPGLLTQYICGGITSEAIASSVASAVRELVDQGFTADEATAAHQLVSLAGVGAAVQALRDRQAGAEEDPDVIGKLRTVIVGIAAGRGENWRTAAKEIDRVFTRPQTAGAGSTRPSD